MTTAMPRADRVQTALIDLFVLGVAVQFFLAGLGVFGADHPGRPASASTFDAHRAFGNVLVVASLLIMGASIAAKKQIRLSGLLLVLMVLQSVWAKAGSAAAIGALHVLGALAIAIVAFTMHRATRRSGPDAPGDAPIGSPPKPQRSARRTDT